MQKLLAEWAWKVFQMFLFWSIKKLGELSESLLATALEIPKPKKKRKGVKKSRKRKQRGEGILVVPTNLRGKVKVGPSFPTGTGERLPNSRVSPLTLV